LILARRFGKEAVSLDRINRAESFARLAAELG